MGEVILWSLVLFVFVIAAFAGVVYVKRRVLAGDEPTRGIGFSLGELRQLHKSGLMTTEEFERAKAKMLLATANAPEVLTAEQKAAAAAHRAELDRRRASDNAENS
jgi:hypothetical protein